MWKYEKQLKSHVKIRNTIKITCENTKYDENHMCKYEIGLKSHVKIRKTIKITCKNTKYD